MLFTDVRPDFLLIFYNYLFLYLAVPLLDGQGCIAGPKQNWVGIYWVAPTVLYTLSVSVLSSHVTPLFSKKKYLVSFFIQFGLAVMRSVESLHARPLSVWKLMLRDGLNLYGVSYLAL